MNKLSCRPKALKISKNSDGVFIARHPQKSSQLVSACAAGDGAICSEFKNRKIVSYHRDNLNTRNGTRLRFSHPIMAPGEDIYGKEEIETFSLVRKQIKVS